MKLRITAKSDAEERRRGRPMGSRTTLLVRADGRVFQQIDDPMGDGSTRRLVDVTDLFDVVVETDQSS